MKPVDVGVFAFIDVMAGAVLALMFRGGPKPETIGKTIAWTAVSAALIAITDYLHARNP